VVVAEMAAVAAVAERGRERTVFEVGARAGNFSKVTRREPGVLQGEGEREWSQGRGIRMVKAWMVGGWWCVVKVREGVGTARVEQCG
jgi:hypothetical protein